MCVLALAMAGARPTAAASIALEWTATGNDADAGTAFFYDLRFSASAVQADTTGWWNSASAAIDLPTPSPAGQTDSTLVENLLPGTTYYFILRSVDEAGNVSPFSNVAAATTDTTGTTTGAPTRCDLPIVAPSQFRARVITGGVSVTWAAPTDPHATTLRIWRATGSGTLRLLTSVSDPAQLGYTDTTVREGRMYRYRAAWSDSCGDGPATSSVMVLIPEPAAEAPAASTDANPALHVYPNPATDVVRFVFNVSGSSDQQVHVRLYDMAGHVIADIVDGHLPVGETVLSWNRTSVHGDRVAPGYYESIGTVGQASVRERIVLLP